MKYSNYFLFLFIVLFFLISCREDSVPDKWEHVDMDGTARDIALRTNSFGFKLLKKINFNATPDQNFLVSPLSAVYGLAMIYNGSEGATKKAIEDSLQFADFSITEVDNAYKQMRNAFMRLDDSVHVFLSNSIWYRDTFPVKQTYIDLVQDFFFSDVRGVRFASPAAPSLMNQWIAQNSDYHILSIINQVDTNSMLLSLNALYFKGAWRNAFNPHYTRPYEFVLADGTKEMDSMMVQKEPSDYYVNDRMEVAELPFWQGNYVMDVFLPLTGQNVNDIISQMNDDNWNTITQNFKVNNRLQIYLPKLKMETIMSLKQSLEQLGLGQFFSETDAELPTVCDQKMFYSDFLQKIVFSINEVGSKTATVATTFMEPSEANGSLYDFDPFVLKKPFLIVIREKDTNTILFFAKIVNP